MTDSLLECSGSTPTGCLTTCSACPATTSTQSPPGWTPWWRTAPRYSTPWGWTQGKCNTVVWTKCTNQCECRLPLSHVTQGNTSDTTVARYYSMIDRASLDRLYNIYRLDFLLFNYTADQYYAYVSS